MKTHTVELLKRLAAIVLFAPALAMASEAMHLDKAPVSTNEANLQNGAKLFIERCLNCHSASMLHYSDLQKIGYSDKDIAEKFLHADEKVGDYMKIAMTREDAENWFGTAPPDLSLIAKAKASDSGSGADYLYTYLRGFYKDENRPTGWNNKVFANVGMPHVLWDIQGTQVLKESEKDGKKVEELVLSEPGSASVEQYDKEVADLVSFMVWMAEPVAVTRKTIGIFVLVFLACLYVLTHALGKTYWKDIH
ncbi:MAG: cytochrome c1 [Azoarcus sp.]|jgi:ubiquinol-cytochrome c reductase cytochrome c1 subunit|nr:cytochrome c1 [Azoarcus sp.]